MDEIKLIWEEMETTSLSERPNLYIFGVLNVSNTKFSKGKDFIYVVLQSAGGITHVQGFCVLYM